MSIKAITWAAGVIDAYDMPSPERFVLVALAIRHNQISDQCFPSYQGLSDFTGLSRKRVITAVKNLQTWGLIRVEKRRIRGHQGSNSFVLFGKLKVSPKQPKGTARVNVNPLCKGERGTLSQGERGTPDKEEIDNRRRSVGTVVKFPSQERGS
jgi:biotin operon repressor